MAAAPAFAATPHNGAVASVVDATKAGVSAASVFVAGASGSKIEEITVKADGDPADCTVCLYLYDGSAYWLWDEWDIGNPAAGSTTVAAYRETRTYENLILKSGWTLRVTHTVATTSGSIFVHAFGGDF